jgi:MFS family permease
VAKTAVLSFIVVFGVTKALTNYLAGRLSDRFGAQARARRRVARRAAGAALLMWAPSWGWVLVANALLGVSQGLTWSTTVIMKIDLAGPAKRGLAMGLNEFAGYFAVAGSALATGYIAAQYGLRPEPFYLGVVRRALGLGLSVAVCARDQAPRGGRGGPRRRAPSGARPQQREVFWRTTLTDKDLSSVSQAGLVNNLNDGMAWGLFPLFFAAAQMDWRRLGARRALPRHVGRGAALHGRAGRIAWGASG